MKDQILRYIDDPEMLEMLYQKDKAAFLRDFKEASAGIDTGLVRFWKIRLQRREQIRQTPGLKNGLAVVAVISVVTALLSRLPLFIRSVNPEDFYLRNLSLLVFAGLTAWTVITNRIPARKVLLFLLLPALVLAFYLNLLPGTLTDTAKLALLHAPLFMGFLFALARISLDYKNTAKISGFIRYCGELAIMTGLLALAGAVLTGMTIGMFSMIGMEIEQFYTENIVIAGVAVLPVIAAWLTGLYPGITDRIAPVIARIFTPLVLLSAVIYLAALFLSGTSLSENRDFLLIFNIMLLCVMAIIVFSLSELDKSDVRKLNVILLFLLAGVTLLIDLFALSAIVTRLAEGFTPNRTAVLVSNLLILLNLLLVLPGLYQAGFRGKSLEQAERTVSRYLPLYFIYSIVVIFIFPLFFSE